MRNIVSMRNMEAKRTIPLALVALLGAKRAEAAVLVL
jgi:hypothetical protein